MFKSKKYVNKPTSEEIKEKGFSVYNYISLDELMITINKDYLEVLNKINTPFIILTVIVSYFAYEVNDYSLILYLFSGVYSLIFLYLLGKLFYRTYKFSQITNIIYTHKGLVIGEELFNYENDSNLNVLLEEYKELFSEYLSKPSNLKREIQVKKGRLEKKIKSHYDAASEHDGDFKLFIILGIYTVSIILFYYIGLIIGFLVFLVFLLLIHIYFLLNKSIEIKIKQFLISIDKDLDDLENIYKTLNENMSIFNEGEIFNLSKSMEKELNTFYSNIDTIIDNKDKLKALIESSKYNDFIDFPLFAIYLKTQFNKPLNKMVLLLQNYQEQIKTQIDALIQSIENIQLGETNQLELKLIRLQSIDKNLNSQLSHLKASIL